MTRRLLLDTDVLVEYLRGRPRAAEYLERLDGELHVSVVTVAELFAGAREGEEDRLRRFLATFAVRPVTESVAEAGGRYRGSWGPSHGTGLADALIAATASETGCTLVTFNERHFPMLDAVEVPYGR
ncbi:MAG: type II toxin-antitoxin system VapC family toxin [Gemmatimonadota bacterium]